MRIILIDDEWNSLDLLERLIQSIDTELYIVGKFQNPLEAIPHILARRPDVLFIDLEMPQLNGIDLITMMSHLPSHFILVTGGDASNWIQANCPRRTQQLQKPFSGRDLAQILQTIAKQLSTTANNQNT